MRRVVGLVLAGLGTCLIVFAVLMPAFVSSRVLKFPLNEYETANLTASNVSYFSPTKLSELTGVNMEATYTLKGDAAAGSSSTAVWNEFTYVYDETNKLPFQTLTRTFAFNRRTAQLIDCCGANVNGDSAVRQTGYVGYVLPIGTQKQTYDIFDANVNKPEPFTYSGTGTVDGIQTYEFVENVAPTQNGTQTLPGSLVGMSQASVTLPQYYQNHVTYWIDPQTGALLNVTEDEKLTLENSSGGQALLLLDANLAATPASVSRVVAQDNSERSKMSAVSTIVPLVTGIVGVVLLIVGILLSRRPHDDVQAGPAAAPERAADGDTPSPEAAQSAAAQPSLVPGLDDAPDEPAAETQTEAAPETTAAAEAAAPEAADAEHPAAEEPAAEAETAEQPAAAETVEAPADETVEQPAAAETIEAPADETVEQPAAAETVEAPAAETVEAEQPATPESEAEGETAQAETPAEEPAAEAPQAETAAEAPEVQADEATVESPQAAPAAEGPEATTDAPEAPAEAAPADASEAPADAAPADAAPAPAEAAPADAEAAPAAETKAPRHRRSARHSR
jgi:hypothetical protein